VHSHWHRPTAGLRFHSPWKQDGSLAGGVRSGSRRSDLRL